MEFDEWNFHFLVPTIFCWWTCRRFQDGTLEGRYATALFMASKDKLDKVKTMKMDEMMKW